MIFVIVKIIVFAFLRWINVLIIRDATYVDYVRRVNTTLQQICGIDYGVLYRVAMELLHCISCHDSFIASGRPSGDRMQTRVVPSANRQRLSSDQAQYWLFVLICLFSTFLVVPRDCNALGELFPWILGLDARSTDLRLAKTFELLFFLFRHTASWMHLSLSGRRLWVQSWDVNAIFILLKPPLFRRFDWILKVLFIVHALSLTYLLFLAFRLVCVRFLMQFRLWFLELVYCHTDWTHTILQGHGGR